MQVPVLILYRFIQMLVVLLVGLTSLTRQVLYFKIPGLPTTRTKVQLFVNLRQSILP